MILFKEDWRDDNGSLNAIVHRQTKNKTFLRLAVLYSRMKLKNNLFHLALTQPELAKYDPHNLMDDSRDLKLKIVHEIQVNPWYYLREVLRIPMQGGDPIPFEAHRGNISMAWCYFVGLDYISIQPRQTGKTVGAISLSSHTIYFKGKNYQQGMLTKDAKLLQENVSRLKAMRDGLPPWLIHHQAADTDNKEGIKYAALNNEYLTFVGQQDKQGAAKVGRGQTLPSIHSDEPAFIANINITHPVIMASTVKAAENAEKLGMPHSNLYTTTAAKTSSPSGSYMNAIVTAAMPFTEKIFDTINKTYAKQLVKLNSTNNKINGTWSYLQLGKSYQWFKDVVAKLGLSQDEIDSDFLNLWKDGTDSGLLSSDMLSKIQLSKIEPLYTEILYDSYVLNWYVSDHNSYRNKSLVLSMDSSENIGRDFTCLYLLDPTNMNPVATFRCNESNITKLGLFIGEFLVKFRKTIFIPERKSTGAGIIDQIIMILVENNINPFRRIFNQVVQRKNEKPFSEIDINDPQAWEGTTRKYLGFQTTSASRGFLYKSVLMKSLKINSAVIKDGTLISELTTLSIKNGRIDHASGHHDDMVIAYLLAHWLVFEGINLETYGIDVNKINTSFNETKNIKQENYDNQLYLRRKIKQMSKLIDATSSEMMKANYKIKIHQLERKIDPTITVEPIVKDQVKNIYKQYGDVYSDKHTLDKKSSQSISVDILKGLF